MAVPPLACMADSETYSLPAEKGLVNGGHSVYVEIMNVIQYFLSGPSSLC